MKKVVLKQFVLRLLALVLVIVFAIVAPKSGFFVSDEMEYIYKAFIGNKSDYNGILEVWNVDAFESGIKPKVNYLEYCGQRFQKLNKGTYVIVRNLTRAECVNLMNNGEMPDVLSCSYDLVCDIKAKIRSFSSENINIDNNFLDSGKGESGSLYGLAWSFGLYYLISTQNNLEKVGKEANELNKIVYDCGYEYKVGKKTKSSKSLVYAENNGIMPKTALDAYNISRSIQINEDLQEELKFKSQYSAYTSFLANDASILLGTHRDMFRLKAREDAGKITGLISLPLTDWTDLVQFAFLMQKGSDLRMQYAEKLALFLIDDKNQCELEKVGMFSVNADETLVKTSIMRDITPDNFSDLKPKSIFK